MKRGQGLELTFGNDEKRTGKSQRKAYDDRHAQHGGHLRR